MVHCNFRKPFKSFGRNTSPRLHGKKFKWLLTDFDKKVRLLESNTPNPDNAKLLFGKQIIVIEAAGYCPYCEKFRADVVKDYFGDIPLTFRLVSQLKV